MEGQFRKQSKDALWRTLLEFLVVRSASSKGAFGGSQPAGVKRTSQ
jgi:hypothetical protein